MPRRSGPIPAIAVVALALLALAPALLSAPLGAPLWAQSPDPPQLWPEEERLFWFDGPAWLLSEEEREALLGMAPAERSAWIERFLSAEAIPGVAEEELDAAIRRRRALMRELLLSPNDVRARLLFLRGAPVERLIVDCGNTFRPLELWSYRAEEVPGERRTGWVKNIDDVVAEGYDPADVTYLNVWGRQPFDEVVVFKPGPGQPWKLWTPYDGKRVLYTSEMEYYLEQWEESNNILFQARRFDLAACPLTREVDRVTGIQGLRGYRTKRASAEEFERFLDAPESLTAWVDWSRATVMSGDPALEAGPVRVLFPERKGQRIVTRLQVFVPAASELPSAPVRRFGSEPDQGEGEEIRLVIEGVVEEGTSLFDDFRVRYVLPPPQPGQPAVLVLEEPLRPNQVYTIRMRVRDEVGGATAYLSKAFRVPAEPERVELPPLPPEAITALAENLGRERIEGEDDLLLVPPAIDVVLSLWRAEAIVSGDAIEEVTFSVDGEEQLTDRRPPFSAELRLARFPKEQVIRAVGKSSAGEVVDSDEVVVNQARGALAVRITEPGLGVIPSGEEVEVRAQVVVPEGRRVKEVRFEIDGEVVATASQPPWQALVRPPHSGTLSYLSVTAELDDGRTAEDVRFLDAPDFVEQIDVDLLEIYAAVTGRSDRPVKGLTQEDFQVRVDGQPVEIRRFEEVGDLPLTVGIVVDSSGSMAASLAEAMEAARGFLGEVIDVRDHAFSVGFSNAPILLMPPTQDIDAVADSLGRLRAVGQTALHDAVVTGLYYFRGFPGQRAMVLLSDGDDTNSTYPFRDVLEYARQGGVSIYTVGLDVSNFGGAAGKLRQLASETGGRSFFISDADELRAVYGEIEEELRSRYMLAVVPPPRPGDGEGFREVKVDVNQRGLDVRTARGLYW